MKEFGPELETFDEIEDDRLENIEAYVLSAGLRALHNLTDTMQTQSSWKGCTQEEEGPSR